LIRDADIDTLELLFGNPLDVLVSSIRSAIIAPPGKVLNVCDLSAIELCVLAWISGSEFWLNVLKEKLDPYKAFGVHYLNKPYDEITKDERNECKPPALGCGYRLGGGDLVGAYPDQKKTGLWGYAESMGVQLTREQSHRAVEIYRDLSPEVKQMWYDLENAARDCIRDGQPRKVGLFTFDIKAPFMRIRLPSGGEVDADADSGARRRRQPAL
jgi:DNA polymerase bacteriophage-type